MTSGFLTPLHLCLTSLLVPRVALPRSSRLAAAAHRRPRISEVISSRTLRRALLILVSPLLVCLLVLLAHVTRVAFMTVPVVEIVPRSEPVVIEALDARGDEIRRGDARAIEDAGESVPREPPLTENAGEPDVGSTIVLGGGGPGVVAGAFHVHTTASDGLGDFDDVARAASKAGLDYLVLADHDVDPPPPHYRHDVLMVPGIELSTSAGHVLSVGAEKSVRWRIRQEDPIGAARQAGGMVVLAHPVNLRLPWTGSWEDADGMEIVSGDSLFREAMASPMRRLVPALASALASTTIGWLYMHHRPDEAFERWDELPGLVGVCAHDAHGYEGYLGPFRAMQLRLSLPAPLPEDAAGATSMIVRALEMGRAWCTLGGLADPSGFVFSVTEEPSAAHAALRYESLPANVRPRVKLIRDGEVVAKGLLEASVDPAPAGLYRAEVFLEVPWVWGRRELLWIFTSTARIREP